MADIVANVAKGRAVEFFNRVKSADPAASRLYIIPITNNAGALTDDEFADSDDFAAVITAGGIERTANNWNRKTIAAADIAAIGTGDDTNNRFDVDITIDFIWTPGPVTDNVTDLVLCYAAVATPTNAQLVPIGMYDFPITADGSVVTGQVNASGAYRAS
jgi:hypothetical protein